MTKLMLAVLVAWAGWWLWTGPKRYRRQAQVREFRERQLDAEEREARRVLGVAADADEAEIRAAHRRLVSAVHPDRGGSAELTRQINTARDTLLRK